MDVLDQLGGAREAIRREMRIINAIPTHMRTSKDRESYRLLVRLLRDVNRKLKEQQGRLF